MFFVADLSPVHEGERECELTPVGKHNIAPAADEFATPTIRSLPETVPVPMVAPGAKPKSAAVRGRHPLSKPVHKSASASMLTLLIPPTG